MSIYTLIPIIFIVLYAGYWYYVKNKNSQQAQVVNNTDFKAEFANAERYKNSVLTSELPFLQEEMKQEKIDAFNYASTEYGVGSALKDGVKDKLKGMATLGTVRFNTVQTPKYLGSQRKQPSFIRYGHRRGNRPASCIQPIPPRKLQTYRNPNGRTSKSTGPSPGKQCKSIQTVFADR